MEVVVTFTERDKSSYDVVARRITVIEWLFTEPVSERVDAESGLLNEEDAEDATVDKSTPPITPSEASDKHREDQTHEEHDLEVVLVLPDNDRVFIEIRDIGPANSFRVLLHQHPAEV